MKKIVSGRDISSLYVPPFGGMMWTDNGWLLYNGAKVVRVPADRELRYAAIGATVYFTCGEYLWEFDGDKATPTEYACSGRLAEAAGRLFWADRKHIYYSDWRADGLVVEAKFTLNAHVLFLCSDGVMGVYCSAGKRTFYAPAHNPQLVDVCHPAGVVDDRTFWFKPKNLGLEGRGHIPVWRSSSHQFFAGLANGVLLDVSNYFLEANATARGSASDSFDVVVRRNGKIIQPGE